VIRRAAALALTGLLTTGCGVFVAPSPTAGEIGDLVAGLVRRGATITNQVGGDAGCSDPTLAGNAVRYDVRMPNAEEAVPVYVLRWKNQQTFDQSADSFQACVNGFEQAHPGEAVTTFADSPWRVYGSGWSDDVKTVVEQAVHAAAGASPPQEIQ